MFRSLNREKAAKSGVLAISRASWGHPWIGSSGNSPGGNRKRVACSSNSSLDDESSELSSSFEAIAHPGILGVVWVEFEFTTVAEAERLETPLEVERRAPVAVIPTIGILQKGLGSKMRRSGHQHDLAMLIFQHFVYCGLCSRHAYSRARSWLRSGPSSCRWRQKRSSAYRDQPHSVDPACLSLQGNQGLICPSAVRPVGALEFVDSLLGLSKMQVGRGWLPHTAIFLDVFQHATGTISSEFKP